MADTSTVTVVFTDLVSSTELRARVGEEAADQLRREHDDALGAAVVEHRGHVVKGGGDGLLCTFESASDALSATVAMQQAAHRLGRDQDESLQIRIGVSVGDVSWDDGDCFGMPVVEAARLEAAAEPSQILCSELVKAMARGRGGHDLERVGTFDLKGVPDPIDAFVVPWAPAPRSPTAPQLTPFVGRTTEMAKLHTAWSECVDGRGGAVLVMADVGLGKTRLVDEFVGSLDGDALVLAGRCHEGEAIPYGPIGGAIVDWAREEPLAVEAALGRQAPVVGTMSPALRDALPSIPDAPPVAPDVEAHRLHDSIAQVLRRVARDRPVLVVIDDLHCADAGTPNLLRVIGRVTPSERILVVLAFREPDLARSENLTGFVADFAREAGASTIELGGLDAAEVADLLTRLNDGDSVPDDLVTLLVRESGGNPLFIRETLLHLVDSGQIRREGDEWVGNAADELEIPDVLQQVIDRRIERLTADAQRLLAVGSLFDTHFPLGASAEVAELHEADALDALDDALGAQIIEPSGEFDTYRFTTAMYRNSLAAGLNPSRKIRLHRRIAETLEKLLRGPASASQAAAIAAHYTASAELPGAERGAEFALTQGDAATNAAAHADALSAYRAARSLLPAGDDRVVDLQRRVARAAVLARSDAEALSAEFERLGALIAESNSRHAAAQEILELADICHAADVVTAWRLGDIARRYHDGDHDRAWVLLRSWELAERDYNDPHHPGTPLDTPERRELDETSRELGVAPRFIGAFVAHDRDDARKIAQHADELNRGIILGFGGAGDYAEARDILRAAHDHALYRGDIGSALFASALAGRLHFALGEFDAADEMERSGEELVPRLGTLSNPVFQFWGFQAMRRIIADPAVHGVHTEMSEDYLRAGSPDIQWVLASLRAGLTADAARAGDRDGVRAMTDDMMAVVEQAAGGSPNYTFLLCQLAMAHDLLGEAFQADVLERALREKIIAPDFRYPEVDGRLALGVLLGLTDRDDEAHGWFDLARDQLDSQGAVVLRADVPHREARAELRRGDQCDDAHFAELLVEARDHASALGFDAWMAQFDELDHSHRARDRQ